MIKLVYISYYRIRLEEGEVVKEKFVPTYEGELRKHALEVPRCISECSGIRVFGRRIKSLVFSTDVAIIKNINADAVIAVYNFTPQPSITQAIISVSDVPVFAGVGGGYTNGQRSVNMAAAAEQLGAFGVVCNAMITNDAIRDIKAMVEIPLIFTVVSEHVDLEKRLAAGVDIVNVSGAARTPEIVAEIRAHHCHRRAYGRNDPGGHQSRSQRHYIYAPHQQGSVCQGYAGVSKLV